ncbi:myc-associated zinc finger protein [Poecilia latipinna]|uniref:Myc-associated zinc finger protein-like n=1 Tax=Poecilia formosa TaxID=48698 RepID=A0A087XHR0_POEFO|nr:PREDICTED: myc-associated zinc finger protein-like [Poecilia formosa]XP_014854001.1 PREDICTED: myc-associated zinc finger protein-like [Poecilia mexicana]XP_014902453.1 PREDICTED: myc-associated zinc finger protein-like [Poecilia latipinna]
MDAAWSNFLFQSTPTQNQVEGSLQSELMQVHTSSPQTPPTEHIAQPPSTVDTTALSEEPLPEPVKPAPRPARVQHICAICNKQFKNNYNLRRHQSVHTGVRMKDRARVQAEGAKEGAAGQVVAAAAAPPAMAVGAGGRAERPTVPLSLLHLSVPPPLAPPGVLAGAQQPPLGGQDGEGVAMPNVMATVNPHAPPPAAVVMATGATVQRPANPNPNPVKKNHACETCGKAFRDVYHLNRHRLSHSDEKPFSCPICQQRFKRKDRMSHHVRSHQGGVEKPYICPHCGKAFSRPDHLNSHVRQVHSSERPFKCPTCESCFATKDRLRAHMIRHEEKVPCHICGKLLSAAYITDHMRVHNQSQHHVCHLCNRSFTTLTYLRVHAQKHHGQEWKESPGGFGGTASGGVLVCHLCGVQCKTPTQLQGHMGTHSTSQAAPTPVTSNVAASSSVSLSNMVTAAPTVYVTGNTVVDLLVTDCSSIAAPQSHS